MKNRVSVFLLFCLILGMLFTACGTSPNTSVSVDGTWYSVVDATMYNFSDGKITVAGTVVGQYDDSDDMIVLSLIDNTSNLKLYITKMDDVEVLADVLEGEGTIYFCRGLENAEAMIEAAIQTEEEMLESFLPYVSENLIGKWVPLSENAEYESIVISSNGDITFTKPNGDVWKQKLILNEDGAFQYSNLRMSDTPRITLHMSDDGTDTDINKMSVYACSETYSEDYPALGFYGWTYKQEK